jgi:transposase-like protein
MNKRLKAKPTEIESMNTCPSCGSENVEKVRFLESTPKQFYYCNGCHRISVQEDLK